jgi:uncharacterized membrane protein (DUF485 family)
MSLKPAQSATSIDLTTSTGAATDIAPLGQPAPKPAHELTAAEDSQRVDWEQAAATEQFKSLIKAKIKFVAPAVVFYMIYYFALLVLVGYKRDLMETQVLGVNLAYLFALSQFVMAWVIAALYVRAAGRFDKMAEAIVNKLKSQAK